MTQEQKPRLQRLAHMFHLISHGLIWPPPSLNQETCVETLEWVIRGSTYTEAESALFWVEGWKRSRKYPAHQNLRSHFLTILKRKVTTLEVSDSKSYPLRICAVSMGTVARIPDVYAKTVEGLSTHLLHPTAPEDYQSLTRYQGRPGGGSCSCSFQCLFLLHC